MKLGTCTLAVSLLLSFVACSTRIDKAEAPRPNIVVVMCDDLGYADVGFNGSTDIKTPALDQLANEGMKFTSAYVIHPFCGPSRAGLMVGRYPHKIGAQFNLPPNSETIGKGIDLNEKYISSVLQDAGYYTGAIGKWHLGSVEAFHPNNRGFDEYYGFLGGGHKYFPEEYRVIYEKQKKAGKKVIFEYLLPLERNGKEVQETEYITDALSREAVQFVKEGAKKDDPFFLYLAYNAPHVPLEAKEEDMALFADIKDQDRRTYAGMVYAVDRGVKQLVDALKQTGEYDNTLIVFLSDNGGKVSKGANNYPLKEGKGSTHEGGYRVPMFFHWPDQLQKGQVFEHPILAIDFYPTFAKLAGASIPENKKLDGLDIWDDIKAGENPHDDDMIYCLRHRVGYTDVGVRLNEWKALKVNQEPWKLFNIVEDMSEDLDLSDTHPEILKALVIEAEQWSQTHQQPHWFHDKATGIDWRDDNMPQFEKTFQLD